MSEDADKTSARKLREELDARFRRPLMRFFMRRVNVRAEAEDLTQEVLLRVLRARHDAHISQAPGFVFRIAINLLRDQHRSQRRRGDPVHIPIDQGLSESLEAELVEDFSPERVLISRDSLADTLRTLDELGDRTRNIFILFRVEHMKQKDIAALYGISQSTVEKHVMRAVVHLAARYGRGR